MAKKYFNNPETLEGLRKQYKELLKKYHPDNGGSKEATKAINCEYEELFKVLQNRHERKASEAENKSSYDNMKCDFTEDAKLRDIIQKIIHFEDITLPLFTGFFSESKKPEMGLEPTTYALRMRRSTN